jgi:hypothetical protein
MITIDLDDPMYVFVRCAVLEAIKKHVKEADTRQLRFWNYTIARLQSELSITSEHLVEKLNDGI